jgi:acyl-CoA synthetase
MRPFLTLHDPRAARGYHARGLWREETFYDLLVAHAGARPEALALRDGRRSVTWGELKRWVDGVARAFAEDGLAGGDRVSLWLSNRVEAVVAFLACSRQGYACNPSLHKTYGSAEIAGLLEALGTSVLVTEPGWGADGGDADPEALRERVASLRHVYTPESFPGPGEGGPEPAGDADRVCYLAFTSGTTGQPKCVMHSANTLLANARDMVRDWGHGPESVLLSLSPLSHHIAWVAVAEWLVAGGTLVTDDPPAGTARLDWIVESGATYVMGVPTHAIDVLAEQKARGMDRLGAVRTFYMAGSPIPPSVAEAFVAQGIKPQNVYGMTENSSHQYTHPNDDTGTIVATCGRGGPAYEIRLFDQEDAERAVAAGEVGQIGGKGAALMLGYYGDQEATAASFNRDGWFLSGDLGVLDEAGNLKVVGRLKDLIIRGGRNIHPAPIEDLALKHARVEKAAAFGVADERLGEKVCLAIIGGAQPAELLDHLDAEGLSLHDMPEYFLALDEFPLTASGKILKRALSDMVRRGELAPEPVRFRASKESA